MSRTDSIVSAFAALLAAGQSIGAAQSTPPTLELSNHYMSGADVLSLEFTVTDNGAPGDVTSLEYKGANGNPSGPPDWTAIPYANPTTLTLSNPAGQQISVRAGCQCNGQQSEYAQVDINCDDYVS